MWLLLLDSWIPPAKYLFWPQKSVAISFLPRNCLFEFLWFWQTTMLPHCGLFFHFTVAVRNPGLITFTLWPINFSPSLFYHWRNVKADVPRCFFVLALAFWAPILHRRHGNAGFMQQFHRVPYVQFVENMLITLKLWTENFHKFCCWLFQQGHHSWRMGGLFDLRHTWAIFELPNSLLNFPLTHYTSPIKTMSLHGFQNWQDFLLSCSTSIDVIQHHTTGWHCNIWLHSELLNLIVDVRIYHDSHGCCAPLTLTFWMHIIHQCH